MKKIILFSLLIFSSNVIAQQVYGAQRGQRGYIPPPKYEPADATKKPLAKVLRYFRFRYKLE